ncbi:hypothetical protein [Mucilaginibacter sp.]|jgi:hypothetical protein|uniref:DUF7935 family protein n=1 Tax=Mucilaginibacter sp. TaxID=1882438 RepID=UPI00356AF95E
MILYNLLIDILKYTIAGMGVVYIAFYLFKPYLDKSNSLQLLDLKKAINSQTLPLRLQAYERLVLFTDRINPANLLIRLNGNGYTAAELHSIIVAEVRNEYQHNVTQQIYVSDRAWAVTKRVKEDTLSVVNNAVKALPETATGLDLGKIILNHLSRLEDNPYDIATNLIRKDLEDLF